MNMWSLFAVGPLVERLYGNLAFGVISLASRLRRRDPQSLGSCFSRAKRCRGLGSAICGILGATVAFLIVHRRQIPKTLLKSFRGSLLSCCRRSHGAFWATSYPTSIKRLTWAGLVTGFVCGFAFWRPWPVAKPPMGDAVA